MVAICERPDLWQSGEKMCKPSADVVRTESQITLLWLAQVTPLSLNCRFVLCHGALPSCSKGLSLFLLFQNRMLSSSEMLTCWVRFSNQTLAGFAQWALSSSHLVVLMVKILYSSRTQCSQLSEEIWPQHAFNYTEECVHREKNKKRNCFCFLISPLEQLYFVVPQNMMIKIETAVGLSWQRV